LYEIGDALSQELFKISWSSTMTTSMGLHIISRQKQFAKNATRTALALGDFKYISSAEQYAIDPAALGSKCSAAMKSMGFEQHTEERQQQNCNEENKMIPLAKLESKLFKHLLCAVEIAAFMDPADASRGLNSGGFDGLLTERFIQLRAKKRGQSKIRDLSDKY
jgi:hypothetical protein